MAYSNLYSYDCVFYIWYMVVQLFPTCPDISRTSFTKSRSAGIIHLFYEVLHGRNFLSVLARCRDRIAIVILGTLCWLILSPWIFRGIELWITWEHSILGVLNPKTDCKGITSSFLMERHWRMGVNTVPSWSLTATVFFFYLLEEQGGET